MRTGEEYTCVTSSGPTVSTKTQLLLNVSFQSPLSFSLSPSPPRFLLLFSMMEVSDLQFEGLDKDITNASYGGSVPVDVFKRTDVMLAYLLFLCFFYTYFIFLFHLCLFMFISISICFIFVLVLILMSFRYEMNGRELPRDHGYPGSPTLSHLSLFFSSFSLYLLFI